MSKIFIRRRDIIKGSSIGRKLSLGREQLILGITGGFVCLLYD